MEDFITVETAGQPEKKLNEKSRWDLQQLVSQQQQHTILRNPADKRRFKVELLNNRILFSFISFNKK